MTKSPSFPRQVIAALAFVVAANAASAISVATPEIQAFLPDGVPARFGPSIDEFEQEGKKWKLKSSSGEIDLGGVLWQVEEIEFDPDPFVLNNNIFTNITGVTQTVTAIVSLPTVWPAPNLISGTIDIDVIDGGGLAGATVSSAGVPVYTALIDGVAVPGGTLLAHPFSISAPAAGTNNAAASFGPSLSGIPVTTDIGIQIKFNLSPGDTATFISRFDVVVPEPSTYALFAGLLVLGFVAVRRRR